MPSKDIGIDLGTANTVIQLNGKGIVSRQPTVAAVDRRNGKVIAVGNDAKAMIGRAPAVIRAIRPLKGGVIADFDLTCEMLCRFIEPYLQRRLIGHPRIVICIPCGVTQVERRAVQEAARRTGVKDLTVVEEPMAAALGADLPVNEPAGRMIADIGGGTTEVAVIALSGIVTKLSSRTAGDAMDEAIIRYVRDNKGLLIGERTAEEIKMELGSAYPCEEEKAKIVKGRDLTNGLPKTAMLTGEEVRTALRQPVAQIVETVRRTLENTPPELSADILSEGIVLSGGGALLRGLDLLIGEELGIPVTVAEQPLDCVALGAGRCLQSGIGLQRVP